mmetsp:Transcript_59117/g.159300  ORF Transcript_59117/g.159300 Transcript_59117/m.159300 type:complete len:226 (+) Transcript_59117:329-1006(+)
MLRSTLHGWQLQFVIMLLTTTTPCSCGKERRSKCHVMTEQVGSSATFWIPRIPTMEVGCLVRPFDFWTKAASTPSLTPTTAGPRQLSQTTTGRRQPLTTTGTCLPQVWLLLLPMVGGPVMLVTVVATLPPTTGAPLPPTRRARLRQRPLRTTGPHQQRRPRCPRLLHRRQLGAGRAPSPGVWKSGCEASRSPSTWTRQPLGALRWAQCRWTRFWRTGRICATLFS